MCLNNDWNVFMSAACWFQVLCEDSQKSPPWNLIVSTAHMAQTYFGRQAAHMEKEPSTQQRGYRCSAEQSEAMSCSWKGREESKGLERASWTALERAQVSRYVATMATWAAWPRNGCETIRLLYDYVGAIFAKPIPCERYYPLPMNKVFLLYLCYCLIRARYPNQNNLVLHLPWGDLQRTKYSSKNTFKYVECWASIWKKYIFAVYLYLLFSVTLEKKNIDFDIEKIGLPSIYPYSHRFIFMVNVLILDLR